MRDGTLRVVSSELLHSPASATVATDGRLVVIVAAASSGAFEWGCLRSGSPPPPLPAFSGSSRPSWQPCSTRKARSPSCCLRRIRSCAPPEQRLPTSSGEPRNWLSSGAAIDAGGGVLAGAAGIGKSRLAAEALGDGSVIPVLATQSAAAFAHLSPPGLQRTTDFIPPFIQMLRAEHPWRRPGRAGRRRTTFWTTPRRLWCWPCRPRAQPGHW